MNYERYRKALRELGASEAAIEKQIAHFERERTCIKCGECPKCGAPLAVYHEADTWPGRGASKWIQYRCSRDARPGVFQDPKPCGFMMDMLPDETN